MKYSLFNGDPYAMFYFNSPHNRDPDVDPLYTLVPRGGLQRLDEKRLDEKVMSHYMREFPQNHHIFPFDSPPPPNRSFNDPWLGQIGFLELDTDMLL